MKDNRFSALLVFAISGAFAISMLSGCAQIQELFGIDEGSVVEQNVMGDVEIKDPDAPAQEVGVGDGEVIITNRTGYTISEIAIRANGTNDWQQDMVYPELVILNDETFTLHYPHISENGSYDIRLTTSDAGIIISRGVPLNTLPSFNLEFGDGVGFVSYVDEETNETKDNREQAIEAEVNSTDGGNTFDQDSQRD